MWRIRKDGGLAIVEQDRKEALAHGEPAAPKKSKTYSVLGIASGTTVQVNDPTTLNEDNSVPSTPFLTVRILLVTLLTLAVSIGLSLDRSRPLEAAANPEVTPNPAKAPWYFLGLQEMVGYSALMGGVIVPTIVILGLMLIPFLDREQKGIGYWFTDGPGQEMGRLRFPLRAGDNLRLSGDRAPRPDAEHLSRRSKASSSSIWSTLRHSSSLLFAGMYFVVLKKTSSTRYAAIATFCAFIIAFVILTYTGTALRGPNWDFYWPWQAWPTHPTAL